MKKILIYTDTIHTSRKQAFRTAGFTSKQMTQIFLRTQKAYFLLLDIFFLTISTIEISKRCCKFLILLKHHTNKCIPLLKFTSTFSLCLAVLQVLWVIDSFIHLVVWVDRWLYVFGKLYRSVGGMWCRLSLCVQCQSSSDK